tara:strand:+ start:903 stop:1310 length:408 start_codon:yes stop_codon:yes gene_type:complete
MSKSNIKQIVDSFPLSDVSLENKSQKSDLNNLSWLGISSFYTKKEVDRLIKEAVDEARRIDEESMRKHNRDATIISMILGFTCLALFVDGLLRILGIIPPFMDIDVNILEDIAQKTKIIVENDLVRAGLSKLPKL